jgi:predicted AlkP superfamily pyrophosphatase or phosphodiesterase
MSAEARTADATAPLQLLTRLTGRVGRIPALAVAGTLIVFAWSAAPVQGQSSPERPRLILQITVDQLRGDLPLRYMDRFPEGGFRYLMQQGTWYLDAHHAHANTETIVGHTTLATGAHPSAHGMVGNIWFDRAQGHTVYNIEDPDTRLLTEGGGVNADTEIDPTQRVARTDGRSPAAILTSTFSDELALGTAGRAKIFGVSVKDRGAVSMAGHAGLAFWFSKQTGQFVTSTYYYDAYPDWVTAWNEQEKPLAYAGTEWSLMADQSSYMFGDRDDREGETELGDYGRVFPHPYGPADSPYFTTLLTLSPAGDALTVDFAKALVDAEDLGADEIPDYLAISLSSTDYVGHFFGPSSLESEDNMMRLDRLLAELFEFVDDRVGLDETLIVLSADHGAAEIPSYLRELGIPAGHVDVESWNTTPGLTALEQRFGVGESLIASYDHPYLYLDRDVIEGRGLDQGEVEAAVAEELMKLPGVSLAVSSTALREGRAPETPLIQAVRYNFNPRRSGDVFVVFEPGHFISGFDGQTVASTHGSPWRYDTYVPVVFAGWGIDAQAVHRRVQTVDVAPTLSNLLGIKVPSGSAGVPLVELFR